jgi:hypothetical protein
MDAYWPHAVLAQAVSTEQAAKALADQTYNQPVNWWLAFFLGLVTIGAIIMVIRSFRKSDATELLLRQVTDDRVATADKVLLGKLEEIKEIVNWIKERMLGGK